MEASQHVEKNLKCGLPIIGPLYDSCTAAHAHRASSDRFLLLTHRNCLSEWRRFVRSLCYRDAAWLRLAATRPDAGILVRARTGHTHLNECLARIDSAVGGVKLVKHVILQCPMLDLGKAKTTRSSRTQMRGCFLSAKRKESKIGSKNRSTD